MKKQTLLLFPVILLLLTACSPKTEPPPAPTQTLPPGPLNFTYCDIDRADICLEGFGLGSEDELMAMFTVDDPLYADIYIRADGPDGEMRFKCRESENFAGNIYCLGEPFPEGERIKLNVYLNASDKFLAIGVFNVSIGALPESDAIFQPTMTPVPSPASYPPPTIAPTSRPSYPNPSYPNQTSTPTASPTPTSTFMPDATITPEDTSIVATSTSLRQ